MDIALASFGLLITAPFWPLIAVAIKLGSFGPAIIKLPRVSGGKTVSVYKFRSMINKAHKFKPLLTDANERKDGPFFKLKNDPRLTGIGKLLRKFRIDEIPQLVNVLSGELSLIGPRPHEPEEVIFYPPEYRHLMLEKAGVTGLSQVSGASSLPFLKELELDSHYVKNRSAIMDAKILAKTAKIIFSDPTAV